MWLLLCNVLQADYIITASLLPSTLFLICHVTKQPSTDCLVNEKLRCSFLNTPVMENILTADPRLLHKRYIEISIQKASLSVCFFFLNNSNIDLFTICKTMCPIQSVRCLSCKSPWLSRFCKNNHKLEWVHEYKIKASKAAVNKKKKKSTPFDQLDLSQSELLILFTSQRVWK